MAITAPLVQPASHPWSISPWRISHVRRELADTFTLTLDPPAEAADAAAAFQPGQFNMLYVFGCGEVPISISGAAGEGGRLKHTIRAVGAVTRALQRLRAGDVVGVRGPFGAGWPIDDAAGSDVVIVAGGIGLAPLRPAVEAILHARERYGRFIVLYGARSPEDILFARDLGRWSSRLDTFVDVTVDRAAGAWRGNVGLVTALIARVGLEAEHTVAFLCGPEAMMRFAVGALAKRGVEASRTYLSLERNMKCGVGLCGRCQLAGQFVCRDGPVFRLDRTPNVFQVREL
ncbi:MAG: FAD/NAD(P)-binding protein [Rhodospirillales bacterium]|nr:FAD/NAD(P)-binding protein [Rhodospirillales bacterium]